MPWRRAGLPRAGEGREPKRGTGCIPVEGKEPGWAMLGSTGAEEAAHAVAMFLRSPGLWWVPSSGQAGGLRHAVVSPVLLPGLRTWIIIR